MLPSLLHLFFIFPFLYSVHTRYVSSSIYSSPPIVHYLPLHVLPLICYPSRPHPRQCLPTICTTTLYHPYHYLLPLRFPFLYPSPRRLVIIYPPISFPIVYFFQQRPTSLQSVTPLPPPHPLHLTPSSIPFITPSPAYITNIHTCRQVQHQIEVSLFACLCLPLSLFLSHHVMMM